MMDQNLRQDTEDLEVVVPIGTVEADPGTGVAADGTMTRTNRRARELVRIGRLLLCAAEPQRRVGM